MQEREGRPGDSLCSRNARPRKSLVGRAHDGNPPGHPLRMLGEEGETGLIDSHLDRIKLEKVEYARLIAATIRHAPLRKELYACGVNHLTMFPDLDVLGRQLN